MPTSEETLGSDLLGLSFRRVAFKTILISNITKIPFAFKPEPSLNLTPTLYFELRFPMFIIYSYDRKENAFSPWTSCNNITVPRNISIKFITTYQKSLLITT